MTSMTAAEAINAMHSRPVYTGPPDPLSGVRADLDRLVAMAPAVGVARQLVDVTGTPCVAIDRATQRPTSAPLTSLAEVAAHYRQNPADGVALLAGAHPGRTIVALRVTPAAWRAFVEQHCLERRPITDEDGRVFAEDAVMRDLGQPVFAQWTPPAAPQARTVAAVGRAALERAADLMTHGDARKQAEQSLLVCWSVEVLWSVPPMPGEDGQEGRQLRFKTKKLATGVEVIADGPVPWHLDREDDWTFGALIPPMTAPMPQHLVDALGGRWDAVVTAGGAR